MAGVDARAQEAASAVAAARAAGDIRRECPGERVRRMAARGAAAAAASRSAALASPSLRYRGLRTSSRTLLLR